MGNYDIAEETRELTIQWIAVLLLVHAGEGPKKELPPPFGQIKTRHGGNNTRGEIYMTGNLNRAVGARIKKANNTWKQVSSEKFRNKAFNRKIKILLRNSH